MIRFILTGLCLLQFQVTYSSYVSRGSKPACFPTYNPISTNYIRDDSYCSKQLKDAFLLLRPKPLHRFQPFFVRQHDLGAPTLFENAQSSISTPIDSDKRITGDFCCIKPKEASHVNNVSQMLIGVETPPPSPEETIYEEEASKQSPPPADTQDRDGENLSYESLPEDEVVSSSDPISVDIEGQEGQSSLNPSDDISFSQGPATPGTPNDETPSLNPSSIISETDRGLFTETIRSESDDQAPKLEECPECLEGSAEQVGPTESNPVTIEGEPQLSGNSISTRLEIPQSFPAQSISLDTACENVSSASAVEINESSPSLLNTECVSPGNAPIVTKSFSGITLPTAPDLGQISSTLESHGTGNKVITGNPVSAAITKQCTNILSNIFTGLSSISTNTSPSRVKPIYEEVIRHVPTVRNVVRHHIVDTTHHVPIVERIVQQERQDIIKHVPIVQKFTRNVVEWSMKHIPIVRHRTRTIEEPYIEHVLRTEKITRPVIETLVKHVPVVFNRYEPVVHQRIRNVPTVETSCVPVVEETITTVPVKQKVIKHVAEDRIRTIVEPWVDCIPEKTLASPSSVSLGPDHLLIN